MQREAIPGYIPIFDEARLFPPPGEEEHRMIDHLFEHDANEEDHVLVEKQVLGKRVQLSWSLTWMCWDFGVGAERYASKGVWKQQGGDLLDAWLNLGPLTVFLEVKCA